MWVVWKSLVLQTKKWKGSTINIKWKYIWKQIEPAIKTNDKKPEVRKNLQKKIIEPQIKNETSKEIPNKVKKLKNENKGSKFFSYLIVFIISIVALIILLDTLKTPLINVFPGLEIVLFNLFETLQDIKLFIIDLI